MAKHEHPHGYIKKYAEEHNISWDKASYILNREKILKRLREKTRSNAKEEAQTGKRVIVYSSVSCKRIARRIGLVGIYIITCKENGKCYIGQSWDIERRRTEHFSGRGGNPGLTRAINKYGKDSFEFKILHEIDEINENTQKVIDDLEQDYIKQYRSNDKKHGYNITSGGYGYIPNEETIEKIREASKRNAQRLVKLESWRKNNAAAQKAKRIEIVCVETGVVYLGIRETSDMLSFSNGNLQVALRNPDRKCGGFHWRYADDAKHQKVLEKHIQIKRQKESERDIRRNSIKKPRAGKISKWNTEWHDAVKKRNEEKKKKSAEIAEEIKRIGRSEYYRRIGSKWLNDPDAFKRWQCNHRLTGSRMPRPVICVETGIVFESRTKAEKHLGLSKNCIRQALDKDNRTAGGYHWHSVNEREQVSA